MIYFCLNELFKHDVKLKDFQSRLETIGEFKIMELLCDYTPIFGFDVNLYLSLRNDEFAVYFNSYEHEGKTIKHLYGVTIFDSEYKRLNCEIMSSLTYEVKQYHA